ncbi:site-specific integrase [Variovorax saccharolyticus]|uniref:site-specific integrase n=1 Tax=Variovorax saccharolyticus TaxID=3053516 RepID=UPI002574CE35|nr:site-specific integrase [Variovorax sp. J22R187]MDM0018036.1 site-specific integrase [Variovorax sp. J22R187]
MATVQNRSPYVISVARRPELTRKFSFSQLKAAKAYMQEMKIQHPKCKVDVSQEESHFQVRLRNKGHREQTKSFESLTEADQFIKEMDSQQSRGLFRDYTAAYGITTAQLIQRYIEEECAGLKGGANYTIILKALAADSTNELRKRIDIRKRELKEFGRFITPLGANRHPMGSLEWLNKPLPEVTPVDIETFVRDRLEFVVPSTVDRQLDLLQAVYKVATSTWGYYLDRPPMQGVRRPKYFNERDRRLKGDEEVRLLDAARREDQLRSIELRTQELMAHARTVAATQSSTYAQKTTIKEAYDEARAAALGSYKHVPFFEAFVMYLLGTAARRGEALAQFWDRIDFEAQTAYLPTSKNGRPRVLAVRRDLLELLGQLPRTSDLVFDIGVKELCNAWNRICEDAGIEDLHMHDLRHEGISRAAESGLFPTVLDLQAYSGHRDLRSLSRYTHLMPSAIAKRLDQAEENRLEAMGHKGRLRLKQSAMMFLGSGMESSAPAQPSDAPDTSNVIPMRRPNVA